MNLDVHATLTRVTTREQRLVELGKLARTRRVTLQLTQDQIGARAGVDRRTVARVEQGKPLRGLSYSGIESALGYEEGSFDTLVDTGDEPKLRPGTEPRPLTSIEKAQAAIALMKDPTVNVPAHVRDFILKESEQILEQLQSRGPRQGE